MSNSISHVVGKYISGITADEFHRYKSWDNCFYAFGTAKQTENQVLELAFYLASWGMYRGSSGLLQKNHLIHKGAVDIIFSDSNQKIKCNYNTELKRSDINAVIEIKNQLAYYYSNISFTKGAGEPKFISPTDTLLSKVMLGTLGCVPAYDRYFIDGLKKVKMRHTGFNESSMNELFDFIENYQNEIDQVQNLIRTKTKKHYPVMKILDMYFWQIGYDLEIKERKQY